MEQLEAEAAQLMDEVGPLDQPVYVESRNTKARDIGRLLMVKVWNFLTAILGS